MSTRPSAGERYDRLLREAQSLPPVTTAVAHPCDEVSLTGAVEAARLVREGSLSALDLTEACLARIQSREEEVRAWTYLDPDYARHQARARDEHKGTGAVTRVLIDASDGHDSWGTIGVSENIIEASWEALVDSLEYAMQTRAGKTDPAAQLPVTK